MPADQHQRVGEVAESGGGQQAHREGEAQCQPVARGGGAARRADDQGEGDSRRGEHQGPQREGEAARNVRGQKVSRQGTGRRGTGAALTEREQEYVFGEGGRVREHHGQESQRADGKGHQGRARGGTSSRRAEEEDQSDRQQRPGGPLEGRRRAQGEPHRHSGSASPGQGQCEAHQADHREIDTAHRERQRDDRRGGQQEERRAGGGPGFSGAVSPGCRFRSCADGQEHAAEEDDAEPDSGVREDAPAQYGLRQPEEGHAGQIGVVLPQLAGRRHVGAAGCQEQESGLFHHVDFQLACSGDHQHGQGDQDRSGCGDQ
ncbi:hypothetical protein SSPIM334S_07468 [Streptomyces spiroverticillatus]